MDLFAYHLSEMPRQTLAHSISQVSHIGWQLNRDTKVVKYVGRLDTFLGLFFRRRLADNEIQTLS